MVTCRDPVLTDQEMAAIKAINASGFKTKVIDSTWPRSDGESGLKKAIERICAESAKAVDDGFAFVVLSDRGTNAERVPIPAILAAGGVHQYLVQSHRRTRVGLVLESGEPRYSCHCQLNVLMLPNANFSVPELLREI
jgi:hypothetical protein